MKNSVVVCVAILAGCAGVLASRLVISPASAQTVQRWEYSCITGEVDEKDFVTKLNKAGQQGWELVGNGAGNHPNYTNGWCFKRPVH